MHASYLTRQCVAMAESKKWVEERGEKKGRKQNRDKSWKYREVRYVRRGCIRQKQRTKNKRGRTCYLISDKVLGEVRDCRCNWGVVTTRSFKKVGKVMSNSSRAEEETKARPPVTPTAPGEKNTHVCSCATYAKSTATGK